VSTIPCMYRDSALPGRVWLLWVFGLSWQAMAQAELPSNLRQRIDALVIDEFVTATEVLESRERACRDTQEVLPANLLAHIALSNEEKKTALMYFSARAAWECQKDATLALLSAIQLSREAGLEEFSASFDPENLNARALVIGQYTMLRYEARYLGLPAAKREQLEAIEGLKWPFKLFESAMALGLRVGRR
jgi:hypothetical protein